MTGGADYEKRIAELEKELAKRDRWNEQQQRRIDRLEEEIDRLRGVIEKLQQSAKRQAAPFSNGAPLKNPRRRGRKPGARYSRHSRRAEPDKVDRVVEVPAPLYCAECHKPTTLVGREVQWVTDIPAAPPMTTEFHVDIARCTACGRTVRSRHPEQISDATGAAGVQSGPRLIALTATLNKECGVSYERISRLLETLFAVSVNRST